MLISVADNKDLLLSSEEEINVNEKNNENGKVESTLPEETDFIFNLHLLALEPLLLSCSSVSFV